MFHIADYADDFAHLFAFIVGAEAGLDAFSQHVLIGKELVCETFVHDHDRRGIHSIVLIEHTASPQRDAHRFEIIGRDDPHRRAVLLTVRQRMFFHVETGHHVAAAQWQRNDGAGRLDARQRADAGKKLVEESDDVFVLWIRDAGQLDARGEKPFRLNTRRYAAESGETLD